MGILTGKWLSVCTIGSCLNLACCSGRLDVFEAAPSVLIDDFEDLNNRAAANVGWWFIVNDGSSAQVLEFVAPDDPTRGLGVLHTTGGPFTGWGADVGVDLTGAGSGYDATGFSSLCFMLKVQPGAQNTTNIWIQNLDARFHRTVQLESMWQKYRLPFAEFVNDADPISRLDPAGITFIQFYFQETGVFDAWLDDVAFVRDP